MGGQQAASVLSTIRRQQIEDDGGAWSAEEEAEFQAPVLEQFEEQGNPYYSTARLWDDGVIDPARTREVLGLAVDVGMRAPMEDVGYGVFRM